MPANQSAGRCGHTGVAEVSVMFLLVIFHRKRSGFFFVFFCFLNESDTRVAERCKKKNKMIYRTLLCQNKRPECVAQHVFIFQKNL